MQRSPPPSDKPDNVWAEMVVVDVDWEVVVASHYATDIVTVVDGERKGVEKRKHAPGGGTTATPAAHRRRRRRFSSGGGSIIRVSCAEQARTVFSASG